MSHFGATATIAEAETIADRLRFRVFSVALFLRQHVKMSTNHQYESEYDPAADVLYVMWGGLPTTHGVEITPGIIVRLTESDVAGGVTVYDVTRRFDFDPKADIGRQTTALIVALLADTLSELSSSSRSPFNGSDLRS
jgi:Protein of unknown function (DUF2283)